ncbi:hypothetical protein NAPIS_ORF01091 [Vairimorpha apis BRL 01]|uniref:Uncharacterized protein n=1 Tax=Vairimorpha apis BRL 01 TaxID=1037528 RepID=T0LAC9_9MICR|nr:hypothetical protein NAPIS_ORF01091 [Vairimorpha apis BRL 01]
MVVRSTGRILRRSSSEKSVQEICYDLNNSLTLYPIQFDNVKSHFLPMFIISVFHFFMLIMSFIAINFSNIKVEVIITGAFLTVVCNLIFSYILGALCRYLLDKSEDTGLASYAYMILLSTSYVPIFLILCSFFKPLGFLLMMICSSIGLYIGMNNLIRGHNFQDNRSYFIFNITTTLIYYLYLLGIVWLFLANIK